LAHAGHRCFLSLLESAPSVLPSARSRRLVITQAWKSHPAVFFTRPLFGCSTRLHTRRTMPFVPLLSFQSSVARPCSLRMVFVLRQPCALPARPAVYSIGGVLAIQAAHFFVRLVVFKIRYMCRIHRASGSPSLFSSSKQVLFNFDTRFLAIASNTPVWNGQLLCLEHPIINADPILLQLQRQHSSCGGKSAISEQHNSRTRQTP